MLDLVASVGKLWYGDGKQHNGTAWLLGPNLALTAAHCVGNRGEKRLYLGSFRIEFPSQGKTVAVTVARHDFMIDAALLQLADPIAGVPELTLAVLPAPQAFPEGKLGWRSYGFASGNVSGMALDGMVTIPNGRYEEQPVIQLKCEQGGVSGLDGESGGPICVAERIVGLIRGGSHAQRVIYATSMRDLAASFPEVKQRLEQSQNLAAPAATTTAPTPFKYTPVHVLIALTSIRESDFEVIRFKLGVNQADLPGAEAPQTKRALALIEKLTGEGGDGALAPMIKLLEKNNSVLMQRIRTEELT